MGFCCLLLILNPSSIFILNLVHISLSRASALPFYHGYQAARLRPLRNSSLRSSRPFACLWLLRLPDKGSLLKESLELGCLSSFSTAVIKYPTKQLRRNGVTLDHSFRLQPQSREVPAAVPDGWHDMQSRSREHGDTCLPFSSDAGPSARNGTDYTQGR